MAEYRSSCPNCGWNLNPPPDLIGQRARCAKCRQVIIVPVPVRVDSQKSRSAGRRGASRTSPMPQEADTIDTRPGGKSKAARPSTKGKAAAGTDATNKGAAHTARSSSNAATSSVYAQASPPDRPSGDSTGDALRSGAAHVSPTRAPLSNKSEEYTRLTGGKPITHASTVLKAGQAPTGPDMTAMPSASNAISDYPTVTRRPKRQRDDTSKPSSAADYIRTRHKRMTRKDVPSESPTPDTPSNDTNTSTSQTTTTTTRDVGTTSGDSIFNRKRREKKEDEPFKKMSASAYIKRRVLDRKPEKPEPEPEPEPDTTAESEDSLEQAADGTETATPRLDPAAYIRHVRDEDEKEGSEGRHSSGLKQMRATRQSIREHAKTDIESLRRDGTMPQAQQPLPTSLIEALLDSAAHPEEPIKPELRELVSDDPSLISQTGIEEFWQQTGYTPVEDGGPSKDHARRPTTIAGKPIRLVQLNDIPLDEPLPSPLMDRHGKVLLEKSLVFRAYHRQMLKQDGHELLAFEVQLDEAPTDGEATKQTTEELVSWVEGYLSAFTASRSKTTKSEGFSRAVLRGSTGPLPEEEKLEELDKIIRKNPEELRVRPKSTPFKPKVEFPIQRSRQQRDNVAGHRSAMRRNAETLMTAATNAQLHAMGLDLMDNVRNIMKNYARDAHLAMNIAGLVENENDPRSDHLVNVCINSIAIGTFMGYDERQIRDLGICAFLHDVGMSQVPMEILNKPGKLSRNEQFEVIQHPIHGINLLEQLRGVPSVAPIVVYQTHERISGKGYPRGNSGRHIHDFAKIIAVAETYAALQAPRPYRQPKLPYEAMEKVIRLAAGRHLDVRAVRALLNSTGLYPTGSWVELNTGEIGRVIANNVDETRRVDQPVVSIHYDQSNERLMEPKEIALFEEREIRVVEAVPGEFYQDDIMDGF